jgi:hypothetical protein
MMQCDFFKKNLATKLNILKTNKRPISWKGGKNIYSKKNHVIKFFKNYIKVCEEATCCVKQGCVHSMCPNYNCAQMKLNNTLAWIHHVKILIWKVIEVNFTLDLHTIVNYLVNWPWGKQTYLRQKNK